MPVRKNILSVLGAWRCTHCEYTCATRSHLRPARVDGWGGGGKGRRGRMGGRSTNRPLGYAGYGQSWSARSQVYPGTPTLAVAPSRIDFNPLSLSDVNEGCVTRV